MEANDHDLVRRVNLIEILGEDDEDVPPPPDDAARAWTEAQIRRVLRLAGRDEPDPEPGTRSPRRVPVRASVPRRADRWRASDGRVRVPAPGRYHVPPMVPGSSAKRHRVRRRRVPPTMRVLCWPSAGNAEDLYTNERASGRAAPSPLLEWCRANRAECLAVQLPGRGSRLREPFLASAEDAANALFPVIASRLVDAPYVIVGHSVGSWLAFEFVRRARRAGFPEPVRARVRVSIS